MQLSSIIILLSLRKGSSSKLEGVDWHRIPIILLCKGVGIYLQRRVEAVAENVKDLTKSSPKIFRQVLQLQLPIPKVPLNKAN
jgi:hypothetical protein